MSIKVGGSRHMNTLDYCKEHVSIRNALLYMLLCPFADIEWEKLPHVILAPNEDWEPTVLDCEGRVDNEI